MINGRCYRRGRRYYTSRPTNSWGGAGASLLTPHSPPGGDGRQTKPFSKLTGPSRTAKRTDLTRTRTIQVIRLISLLKNAKEKISDRQRSFNSRLTTAVNARQDSLRDDQSVLKDDKASQTNPLSSGRVRAIWSSPRGTSRAGWYYTPEPTAGARSRPISADREAGPFPPGLICRHSSVGRLNGAANIATRSRRDPRVPCHRRRKRG